MSIAPTVNPYHLLEMLGTLVGLGDVDDDSGHYESFDSNDEAAVRAEIREHVVPYIQGFTDESIARLKLTVRYYLSKTGQPWEDIFCCVMPPFDPPPDARDYFVWAWEECFPGESYQLEDLLRYTVVSDLTQANRDMSRR